MLLACVLRGVRGALAGMAAVGGGVGECAGVLCAGGGDELAVVDVVAQEKEMMAQQAGQQQVRDTRFSIILYRPDFMMPICFFLSLSDTNADADTAAAHR